MDFYEKRKSFIAPSTFNLSTLDSHKSDSRAGKHPNSDPSANYHCTIIFNGSAVLNKPTRIRTIISHRDDMNVINYTPNFISMGSCHSLNRSGDSTEKNGDKTPPNNLAKHQANLNTSSTSVNNEDANLRNNSDLSANDQHVVSNSLGPRRRGLRASIRSHQSSIRISEENSKKIRYLTRSIYLPTSKNVKTTNLDDFERNSIVTVSYYGDDSEYDKDDYYSDDFQVEYCTYEDEVDEHQTNYYSENNDDIYHNAHYENNLDENNNHNNNHNNSNSNMNNEQTSGHESESASKPKPKLNPMPASNSQPNLNHSSNQDPHHGASNSQLLPNSILKPNLNPFSNPTKNLLPNIISNSIPKLDLDAAKKSVSIANIDAKQPEKKLNELVDNVVETAKSAKSAIMSEVPLIGKHLGLKGDIEPENESKISQPTSVERSYAPYHPRHEDTNTNNFNTEIIMKSKPADDDLVATNLQDIDLDNEQVLEKLSKIAQARAAIPKKLGNLVQMF